MCVLTFATFALRARTTDYIRLYDDNIRDPLLLSLEPKPKPMPKELSLLLFGFY